MRTSIYLLAALTVAGFASVSAQSVGNPPANTAAPPANTATPPANTATPPATTTTPPANSTPAPPPQQTVRPPDTSTNNTMNNPTQQQSRVPPASRGVGTTRSRPDCSKMRGLEKSECERRDTVRDDLPAGVTTTQPKNPPQ